jgi:polypeptide N-acetylgalactosaminyltransferase
MCGGTLLAHPCSHVGHVFRARSPYSFPGGANNIIYKNTRRFIDVWTDEYRDYFYQIIPALNRTDPGDLNARIKLRRDLKCKSFKWYLDNIYPEAPVPRDFIYFGQV